MKSNKLRSPVYVIFFLLAFLFSFLLIGYQAYNGVVDFVKAKDLGLDAMKDFLTAMGVGLGLTLGGLILIIAFLTGVFAKSRPVILLASLFSLLVFLLSGIVNIFGSDFALYRDTLLSLEYWKTAFSSGFDGLADPCLLLGFALTFLFAFFMVCLRYEGPRSAFSVVLGILAFVFGLAGTGICLPYSSLIEDPSSLSNLETVFDLLSRFAPALMGIAVLGLSCYRPKQIPVELFGGNDSKAIRI